MSASRAQQPAAQPTTTLQNWLPMAIDHDNNDSFSHSLIRQFDKRRTRLHAEMEQLGYRHSICFQPHTISSDSLYDSSSVSNGSIDSGRKQHDDDDVDHQHVEPSSATTAPTPLARTIPTSPFNAAPIHRSVTEPRRQCARNLLRRSSAYLRAKFKSAICEDDNNHQDTTTNIPFNKGQDHFFATIQPPPPPVVTQYPPKPLKYSPVEPIEDDILVKYPTRKWFPLKMNRS